ncbi:DUF1566 domain-containing protein [Inhella proteolytica]|uniref:DUF1566 domain-containing protein n=1 Tax=Inhella proteolytica TaxID=2795029 RepID=A0A931J970_9BURK|nr:DUF1566 domain-containing protein [Inhella proteolytica]MBH9578677.1 DUF1566 domain-containing protein [Inhella proteolytica]
MWPSRGRFGLKHAYFAHLKCMACHCRSDCGQKVQGGAAALLPAANPNFKTTDAVMNHSVFFALIAAASCTAAAAATVDATGNPSASPGHLLKGLEARDFNRDGTLDGYFDRELNITWWAKGGVSQSNWSQAKDWAANLDVFGFDDWRLPTATDHGNDGCNWSVTGGTDCGHNVDISAANGSEMARLFHFNLGNKSYFDLSGRPNTDYGLKNAGGFSQLVEGFYWMGLTPQSNPQVAWYFNTVGGIQLVFTKQSPMHALAVADGDIGEPIAEVPEPQTELLASLGVIALIARREKPRRNMQSLVA